MGTVQSLAEGAKLASRQVALLTTEQKNDLIYKIANALEENASMILAENRRDLDAAEQNGLRVAMIDRLRLTETRIHDMANGAREVAELPDPIGEVLEKRTLTSGVNLVKKRVPLGVIGIIFEARPNVTLDASVLCLKSGNATVLRGGKEAIYSNRAIVSVMRDVLSQNRVDPNAVCLVTDTSRDSANELMSLKGLIDVLIPRGGAGLIHSVVENARVPVIETGAGNCHLYIDREADLPCGVKVAVNAKCSRPSVCNAIETLLVHEDIAKEFLPVMQNALSEYNVELRGCPKTCEILSNITPATAEDYATEYNDYILTVRVVSSLKDAVDHINRFGTLHSEAIITKNLQTAETFMNTVDAAAVYVNASTRFTDGFEFGLGAEIGISTQKMHARGPMGLRELTSCKYYLYGSGQTRD
ncbi:MAG: glutamate-5-semialdehyde dehydrogenase [Ruminococcaceae bacterium]|nr:glutamate-5-semialdehyde dehydrogenase [Oscillospiraceae bacterium]